MFEPGIPNRADIVTSALNVTLQSPAPEHGLAQPRNTDDEGVAVNIIQRQLGHYAGDPVKRRERWPRFATVTSGSEA